MAKLKFTIEQAMKAQMGSRGIALLFHLHPIYQKCGYAGKRAVRKYDSVFCS
jgi:hypothetical protein